MEKSDLHIDKNEPVKILSIESINIAVFKKIQ